MDQAEHGLTMIVPAFNEEEGIGHTLDLLLQTLPGMGIPFEIIVVDDGSRDGTAEAAAKREGVRVISHPVNIGYGNALKTGILNARYDWIGIIDADASYPVERIPDLAAEMAKGFDMVIGKRENISDLDRPFKRAMRRIYVGLVNIVTGARIEDPNSGLRIFRKELALEFFQFLCGAFSFTTSLTVLSMEKPAFLKFVPVTYLPRKGTCKVAHFRDSLRTLQLIMQGVGYYNPVKVFVFLAMLMIFTVGFPAMLLALFNMHTLSAYYMIFGCTVALMFSIGVLGDIVRISAMRKRGG